MRSIKVFIGFGTYKIVCERMAHVGILLKLELPAVGDCLGLFGRGNRYAVCIRFERWNVLERFPHRFNFSPEFLVLSFKESVKFSQAMFLWLEIRSLISQFKF
ncbi:hypothetical protein CEXT_84301 [Caerostris extrusa]|uniref:Uncharacterized protein n=1 Tax=Caerostris extrusa TaxID=172846 RepID=A0AAV4R5J7_CAEEX|nr:hypothetical protein CEXT_84301 [Caerostris extrusa]